MVESVSTPKRTISDDLTQLDMTAADQIELIEEAKEDVKCEEQVVENCSAVH